MLRRECENALEALEAQESAKYVAELKPFLATYLNLKLFMSM